MQSTRDRLLRVLGRPGDEAANRLALERIRSVWRLRLNLDFLVGVPGQSRAGPVPRPAPSPGGGGGARFPVRAHPPAGHGPGRSGAGGCAGRALAGRFRAAGEPGLPQLRGSQLRPPGSGVPAQPALLEAGALPGSGPGGGFHLAGVSGEVLRLYHPEDISAYLAGNPWGLRQRENPAEGIPPGDPDDGLPPARRDRRRGILPPVRPAAAGDVSRVVAGVGWSEGFVREDPAAVRFHGPGEAVAESQAPGGAGGAGCAGPNLPCGGRRESKQRIRLYRLFAGDLPA